MGFGLTFRATAITVSALLVGAAMGAATTGAASATTTAATSTATGTPEYPAIHMSRLGGANRYATAVAIASASNAEAPAPTTGGTVFLATGADYPDALAASPVAATFGAPLLLTEPTTLPAVVATELTTLAPATIVVLGGTAAVSAGVQAAVHTAAPAAHITRIGGADRYATARALVRWAMANTPTPFADGVFVVTGGGFADAPSAAAAAGARHQPLIFATPGAASLDAATMTLIGGLGATRGTVIGGTGAVSTGIQAQLARYFGGPGTVTRLGGIDRYATSAAVAQTMTDSTTAYLASGMAFPDALAGAAAAGRTKSPLLLLRSTCVPPGAGAYLHAHTTSATILGGTGALAPTINALVPCSTVSFRTASSTAVGAVVSNGDSPYISLGGVSCPSASRCVAVGVRNGLPIAATMASGRWTVTTLATPAGYQGPAFGRVLTSVSCASATRCVASGTYQDRATPSRERGLVEIYDGSSWTASSVSPPASSPTDTDITLSAVSCAGVSCAIAGNLSSYSPLLGQALAVDVENDTVTPVFVPGDGTLSAASCTATGACMLGGSDDATGGPLSGHPAAGTWVAGPGTSQLASDFTALTCADAGECTAWVRPQAPNAGVIAKLENGAWTAESTISPAPAGKISQVNAFGFACADINFCAAGFDAGTSSSPMRPELAISDNHTTVTTAVPVPRSSGTSTPYSQIDELACPEAGTCVGVGTYAISTVETGMYVDVLANGVWTMHVVPHPANQKWVDTLNLNAISCPTTSICHIVGMENFIKTPDLAAEYAGLDVTVTL